MRPLISILLLSTSASAFVVPQQQTTQSTTQLSLMQPRRGFLVAAGGITATMFTKSVLAVPMVTVDEFEIIMRDSPLSIEIVEFSGPKAETVVIKLVDGSSFGLKDVVESSTDPRSPLKVAAACRENRVPTKFVDLQALLSKQPKKKLYTNQRVQEANAKTRAAEERMREDEQERISVLKRMEAPEGQATAELSSISTD
jgi:hypothetical protein